MRKQNLLLLALLVVFTVEAQPTFDKLYIAGNSFQFNMSELPSQDLLVGLGWARGVSRLDSEGNVLQTHSYWSDSLTGFGGIRKYADNEYLFAAGYRKDICSQEPSEILNSYPVIGKMDTLGNILSMRHYVFENSCSNTSADVLATSDGGAISWGYRTDFFAMKVDGDLEPVWAKFFSNNGGFQFIKELSNGDLLAGFNMDTAGAVVARTDAYGNFLWCKSYIRPSGMIHDALIESDDSFIITGYTDSISGSKLPLDFHPKLFMLKLNGLGEVQWCKGYESEPNPWYTELWTRIERALDGNYVLLATLGQEQSNFFYRPFLMKTDQNGDTLWTRSKGGSSDYIYYARELLACSDGGFICNGAVWGDLPENNTGIAYILKTDSLGRMPCFDRSSPVVISDLFPVDSSFTINSIDGAISAPVFYSDTVLAAIPVYDGCTDIFLSSPRFDGSIKRMRVRPNPNTGRFTVEFEDPLAAESYYSVYDAMGKLLFQRPLPIGKQAEQIDLSRYGAGTYLIKFTSPDGVCHERVVVE